jgi:3-methyladenine DNA glycosylase AlkC
MEPFKNELNEARIVSAGQHIQRVWPAFDVDAFSEKATHGLKPLALKQRVAHIAEALGQTLPNDWESACSVMTQALGEPSDPDRSGSADTDESGIRGWMVWPMTHLVQTRGLKYPELSFVAMHALTQRFSAEFAIRHFLLTWPEKTWPMLEKWGTDPSPHVRRLVSEGTRPKLPWGVQLKPLVADPSPNLALLEHLVGDDSEYVRRSVANHLGDVAKDHPERAVAVANGWWNDDKDRQRLVKHGLRWLIKKGHPGALKVLGFGPPQVSATLTLSQRELAIGGDAQLTCEVTSTARDLQNLMVDYVIHYVKARGSSPKVFKWTQFCGAAGQTVVKHKKITMNHTSTRKIRPGSHRIQLQINGVAVAETTLLVVL